MHLLRFACECFNVLASPRFCRELLCDDVSGTNTELTVVLILDVAEPSRLSVAINEKSTPLGCTIYTLDLTYAALSSHMEDELGLSDDKGLGAFGRPFATAIRSGKLTFNRDDAVNISSFSFPVTLTYNIGSIIVTGTLHLPLVERGLNSRLFSLLYTPPAVIASILSQTADITTSTELDPSIFRTRDASSTNISTSQSTQHLTQSQTQDDPGKETEDNVVVAKRRKLNGTKLFKK